MLDWTVNVYIVYLHLWKCLEMLLFKTFWLIELSLFWLVTVLFVHHMTLRIWYTCIHIWIVYLYFWSEWLSYDFYHQMHNSRKFLIARTTFIKTTALLKIIQTIIQSINYNAYYLKLSNMSMISSNCDMWCMSYWVLVIISTVPPVCDVWSRK